MTVELSTLRNPDWWRSKVSLRVQKAPANLQGPTVPTCHHQGPPSCRAFGFDQTCEHACCKPVGTYSPMSKVRPHEPRRTYAESQDSVGLRPWGLLPGDSDSPTRRGPAGHATRNPEGLLPAG